MADEELFDQEYTPRPERQAQFVLDRFLRIVQEQGGDELPDRCVGDDLPSLTLYTENVRTTQACGGLTRFTVPYEKEDGSHGFVTGCASCDLGTRWPRFHV